MKLTEFCVSNQFGANTLNSLVETRVKTKDLFSTLAVEGVINSEILKSFIERPF